MHPSQILRTPADQTIHFIGPSLEEGIKPTIIYFALSAEMTLCQDPFNQPALEWAKQGIRVFSWDLPFHGSHLDPHEAMLRWAAEFAKNPLFLVNFMQICIDNLSFLQDLNLIGTQRLAVAGLSRGGFIATHLAAKFKAIKWVLGFAPLTEPDAPEDFQSSESAQNYRSVALTQLVDQLSDVHVRFYIGNQDSRVKTDACYNFIKHLADHSFIKGMRSPLTELILYPSIGHKGHGTPPEIFQDGAIWLKNQLLNRVFI